MKTVIGVLAGLGIASLMTGAVLWIHGRTIVQRNREICGILQQQHECIVADLVRGSSPDVDVVLPLVITGLRADTRIRGPDFDVYCKAVGGFALMFCTFAVITWRRQKLPAIERQTAERAAASRRDVRGRHTTKEDVSTRLSETTKKQPVSAR